MYRVVPSGRSPRVRTLLVAVVLLGLLGAYLPSALSAHGTAAVPIGHPSVAASHAVTTHASSNTVRSAPNSAALRTAPSPSLGTHPSATGTGVFWGSSSAFSTQPFNNSACTVYSFSGYFNSNCNTQAVSPTVLNLANGDVAIVYSIYTNASGTSCLGSATDVNERVAIAISSDGGQTFGPIQYLGNMTCTYLDAIEPSFAVSSDGTVYGAYVEYNYTGNQGQYTYRSSYFCCGYPNDALAFTESSDNGVTFSTPLTINADGNISKPQIAVFGETIYVMYENISNGTSYINYGLYGYLSAPSINENLLVSTDGGATWSGPTVLPALGATWNYNAMGGAIAVNATGVVGAAYFTNHDCAGNTSYGTCWAYGDDLVYTTSSTNGSTWAPLKTVSRGNGESQYYMDGYYLNTLFQLIPQASLVFDAAGQTAYIAWSGTYNKTLLNGGYWYYYYNYVNGGIFAAVGPANGAGFLVSSIAQPYSNNNYDDNWNPSVGVSGGMVYVIYTESNETSCFGSCGSFLDGTYSEWLRTSANNGATWNPPTLLNYANTCSYGYCQTYNAYNSFGGFNSAIGFSGTGTPLLVYSLPWGTQSTYQYWGGTSYYNYTYPTILSVSEPWFGPTVTLNFTENNLPPNSDWSFAVDGQTFSTTDTYFTVTNVPMNDNVILEGFPIQAAYGTEAVPGLSVPSLSSFGSDATIYINFSLSFLLNVNIEPTNPYSASIFFYDHLSNYNYYDVYTYCSPCVTQPPNTNGPWYLPAGETFQLNSSSYPGAGMAYWTGSGNGSHNGPGLSANVTMNAPINETGWMGGFGIYNLTVNPVGLPSTSTFSFDLDGVTYSGPATSAINVSGVATGAHEITNVWADSATPGWEYFGQPNPANPVIVPTETSVSLAFSLIDVGAAIGSVSFQAQGLTAGTSWNFAFNGTVYNSQTPWINVSTHPGTFQVAGFPIVSQNASVGYVPSGVGPTWSVTTGSTYFVTYVPAYKVLVVAGNGGGVVGGTGAFWVAAGTSAQYVASAHSGYAFGGWTGTGVGSYTGLSIYANLTVNGPIIQTASFYPLPASRFNLTFTETGLSPGTWWTIFLGSTGFSSNQSTFQVQNLLSCSSAGGNYNLTVPYAYSSDQLTRFIPTSHLPHTICTTGTTVENEVFVSQYLLTLQSTAGGFAEAQIGPNTVTTSVWVPSGSSVALSAVGQTGYDFLGWNGTGSGSYTGPGLLQGIIMGGPVSELATFALHVNPPPATYTITFQEKNALVSGTVWGIVLGGVGYSSTSSTLVVSGLVSGTYTLSVTTALSPDGLTRYTTLGNVPTVNVQHNATVLISYSTSFWVSVSGTPGGTTTPASAWVTSGSTIFLNVTVFDGFQFLGWNGTGPGAYSGSTPGTSVAVSGPISEVATFAPTPVTVTQGGGSSLWSQPTTWIGLGIVGLLIGLVVGLLVSRRSGRQPPAPTAYEAPPAEDQTYSGSSPPPAQGGSA